MKWKFCTGLVAVAYFHILLLHQSNSFHYFFQDAAGLGAMWGREKAKQLLNDAGFKKVEIRRNPFSRFLLNIVYLCRK